jgi:hypothetical protein
MSKKLNKQTCENDTIACKVYAHACRFLNLFFLRLAQFSEHTPECDFNMHEFDFHTHEYDFDKEKLTKINIRLPKTSGLDSDSYGGMNFLYRLAWALKGLILVPLENHCHFHTNWPTFGTSVC